jgi:hypothetical protein
LLPCLLANFQFELLQNQQEVVIARGLGDSSTEEAKRETLDLLVEYLPKRFPTLFKRVQGGMESPYSLFTLRHPSSNGRKNYTTG